MNWAILTRNINTNNMRKWQRCQCSFKNVALQKQNAICKIRAQYANAIALNYLQRIAPQQLMLRTQVFTKKF
jgi:hypothetical protein